MTIQEGNDGKNYWDDLIVQAGRTWSAEVRREAGTPQEIAA